MPKHSNPTLNKARSFAYFSQLFWLDMLDEATMPREDLVQRIIQDSQNLVLVLIPDDDEDAPGMRMGQ